MTTTTNQRLDELITAIGGNEQHALKAIEFTQETLRHIVKEDDLKGAIKIKALHLYQMKKEVKG